MASGRLGGMIAAAAVIMGMSAAGAAAQSCGNDGGGFAQWKSGFVQHATAQGFGERSLSALRATRYNQATINADRGQKSFKLSLEEFMQKRGASAIVRKGKQLKSQHGSLLANIERRYGVPPGPLLAIWGMETNFGGYMGNQNILSSVATLAYDCRRSDFFTRQLYAALELVDRGSLSPESIGAAHGEVGQTQFLPENVIKFGVDGDGDGRIDLIRSRADALASTANFLRGHGWRPGAGYQQGEPNYAAIQGWNAATVYQQAIAIMGRQIDGG